MAHLVSVERQGNIIRVRVIDQMGKKTYKKLIPFIDATLYEYDGCRVLFDLTDWTGRARGAVFEDLDFKLMNWAEVERVAIIGDKKFEERALALSSTITSAPVTFFYPDQEQEAEDWIREGLE